jgi:hypothetical protein
MAIGVEIKSPDLARTVANLERAAAQSGAIVRRRLKSTEQPLKDSVVEAARTFGLQKAARATSATDSGNQITIYVDDAEARYSRFSGGFDRHPVFAHGPRERWNWVEQPIPPFWQAGIEAGIGKAVDQMSGVLDDFARILEGR